MTIKRLALFFLLIVAVEFMLFSSTDAWWGRRRRRRAAPPPTTPPPPPPCDASIPYPKIKWHNKWHQSFYAHCPNGYSLFQWLTVFRKCQQDRLHHFRCRLGPALYRSGHCNWTPHVLHDVKHSFFYKCPKNGFLTGVISYFNKATNDRRIGLKCCNVRGYRHDNCKNTRYVNSFGRTLNFIVPRGYTMVGVGSYHSVASSSISFSDRRWMFEVCQVKRGYRFGKK